MRIEFVAGGAIVIDRYSISVTAEEPNLNTFLSKQTPALAASTFIHSFIISLSHSQSQLTTHNYYFQAKLQSSTFSPSTSE